MHRSIVVLKVAKSFVFHLLNFVEREGCCAMPHLITFFQMSISAIGKSSLVKKDNTTFSLIVGKLSDVNTASG